MFPQTKVLALTASNSTGLRGMKLLVELCPVSAVGSADLDRGFYWENADR
jgi:hypothetical protein